MKHKEKVFTITQKGKNFHYENNGFQSIELYTAFKKFPPLMKIVDAIVMGCLCDSEIKKIQKEIKTKKNETTTL